MLKQDIEKRILISGGICAIGIVALILVRQPSHDPSANKKHKNYAIVSQPKASSSAEATTASSPVPTAPHKLEPTLTPVSNQIRLRKAFEDNPEYHQAYQANQKRQVLQLYGDLQLTLGVDKKTVDRVSELLVERLTSTFDAGEILAARGIKLGTEEYAKSQAAITDEMNDQLKSLLGQDGYEKLQLAPSIQKFLTDIQSKYAPDFRSVSEPLSPEQSRALATVMAVNMNRNRILKNGDKPTSENPYLMQSESAALDDARPILSEKQLAMLKKAFMDRNIEAFFAKKYFPESYTAGRESSPTR